MMSSDSPDPEWPTSRRKKALNLKSGSDPVFRVCIYLQDSSCVCVDVLEGLKTTTAEVLAAITTQEDIGLPSFASQVFGIWATSPLLELQLKPQSCPLEVFRDWQILLKRFSASPESIRLADEPILELRRSAFLSLKEEEHFSKHSVVNKFLYLEAERNFIRGRLPCSDPDVCTSLGAISAKIHYGGQDIWTNTNESHLEHLLPRQLRQASWSWFNFKSAGKNSPEARLIEKYREIPLTKEDRLVNKYLELSRFYPFYGSAYFHGQIEEPVSGIRAAFRTGDTKVLIAVSGKGLHVLDPEKEELLISLSYDSFSWDIVYAKDLSPDCLSSLYIVFPGPDVYGRRTVRIVQIFTKQVAMIDALLSYWTTLHQDRINRDESDVGTSESVTDSADALSPLTKKLMYRTPSEIPVFSKVDRLCLATFDEDGNLIDKRGSWKLRTGVSD
ncbi:FERM domain-containing protein 8-like isoform X2 [Artemia franciscana]|uniref:FERM domain-containing protein 8-like isoform X2 n=1 Tax=Artemia franciscana TaxID=6661 RepID=UPI0032DB5E36